MRTRRKRQRRPIDAFKPKTTSRRQEKASAYRGGRQPAREKAFTRDRGRCVWPTCRRPLSLEMAHEHELLGGRSKVSAVDPNMMVTVCAQCHSDLHVKIGGKRKRIDGTVAGAEGPLRFFERQHDEWIEVTV